MFYLPSGSLAWTWRRTTGIEQITNRKVEHLPKLIVVLDAASLFKERYGHGSTITVPNLGSSKKSDYILWEHFGSFFCYKR
jgi:hypothetical protein